MFFFHLPIVEQCPALNRTSDRLLMNCSHPIAPSSFNSTCEFSCEEGFELAGRQSWTECNHAGRWTADVPTCSGTNMCAALRCSLQQVSVVSFVNDSFKIPNLLGERTKLNHLLKRSVHFSVQLSSQTDLISSMQGGGGTAASERDSSCERVLLLNAELVRRTNHVRSRQSLHDSSPANQFCCAGSQDESRSLC